MSWVTACLSDVAKIQTGKSNKEDAVADGQYAFFDRSQEMQRSSRYLLDAEAVIVPGEGTEFIPRYFVGKFDFHQRVYAITDFAGVNGRFLYYVLVCKRKYFAQVAIGATVKSLRMGMFERFTFDLPRDIKTQNKIASILSAYDDLIENNQRRISLLEQSAKLLYKEWFIHLRFPGHEHTKFASGIPEGWKQSTFGNLFDFLGGFAFKGADYTKDGKYGVVTIKNVHHANFVSDCSSRVDDIPPKIQNHCCLVTGDILLSLTGHVGRCCVVSGQNYLLNQRVAKVVGKAGVSAQFVYWTFTNLGVQKQLEKLAYGVAQLNLSTINLAQKPFVCPSQDLLDRFTTITKPIFDQLINLNLQNQELKNARDLLLPRLISGKIKV